MFIPKIYIISHYILGFLSYKFPNIIPIFFIYQITQFCYNTRFFILELDINTLDFDKCFKERNSIVHTYIKLKQFTIGFFFCILINYLLCLIQKFPYYYFQKENNIHN